MSSLQALLPFIIVTGLATCLVTFIRTDFGIIVLIFSMLLSPELPIIQLIENRALVIRVDDIMIAVVFFTWLAKMAINKEVGLIRKSPLNLPIIAFISINIISTLLGIMTGVERINPLAAAFYILKYIEYFMVYFLIINNIYDKRQIKKFVAILMLTCFIILLYTSAHIGKTERLGSPFEGEASEPNTLGGYLLFLFAISLGIFLYTQSIPWQFSSGFLCLFIIPSFLYTLSRGSYLASIPMYLTLAILSRKKKALIIIVLLLAIMFLPILLPSPVKVRITETFKPDTVYELFGMHITLDLSTSFRVENWKSAFKFLRERPLLGYGVTGVGLLDAQLPLVLGETGLIGFWVFCWLMLTIFRNGLQVFKAVDDDWIQGLSLGFLAGFIGLLVHAFSIQTFIVLRIMEPFWLLTGIVMMVPQVEESSAGSEHS